VIKGAAATALFKFPSADFSVVFESPYISCRVLIVVIFISVNGTMLDVVTEVPVNGLKVGVRLAVRSNKVQNTLCKGRNLTIAKLSFY
jgi:hypothetical protein